MQDELFKDTKMRLSKRIGIKGKQFDKIKFAIIQRSIYAKPAYLNDGGFCGFTFTIHSTGRMSIVMANAIVQMISFRKPSRVPMTNSVSIT